MVEASQPSFDELARFIRSMEGLHDEHVASLPHRSESTRRVISNYCLYIVGLRTVATLGIDVAGERVNDTVDGSGSFTEAAFRVIHTYSGESGVDQI